ncbi:MAG TPA: Rnf-Nqr domain containing protein [Bacteroidales bacterium]|nr:Rnf-Nqr domain containing protein [Bacteroidales bacterium]HPS17585.1 Rnf-Nqr domain containing protein [Bacteroidales bacterium]
MDIFKIIFLSLFVNNVAFNQFLGVRPLLGDLNKAGTALRTGSIIALVMIFVNMINFVLENFVLIPLHLEFLQIIIFILIVIHVSMLIAFVIKKISFKFYRKSADFFQLTSNSMVLGVCLIIFKSNFSTHFLQCVIYTIATTAGYTLALILMATITNQNNLSGMPKGMKGIPISLITIGILILAFMGLSGIF